MSRYALVKNGEILEWRDYAPNVDQAALAPNKPRMLPVIETPYDPITHVDDGFDVQATQVVRLVRVKNADEIESMRERKSNEIESEFASRWQLPITHSVSGQSYEWHADQEAVDNITGVLLAYGEAERIGLTLPDPRNWTPKDSLAPVSITRAELIGLGLAIAARKDALFVTKKQKQYAVTQLSDPAAIDSYDAAGWD